MSDIEDHMYLNLTDVVDLEINRWVKDAMRTRELNDLCGLNGEAPDPYEVLLRQLEFIEQRLVPDTIERVEFLKNHRHEWDEDSFCIHCGADGAS